jgi:hypothetical protein
MLISVAERSGRHLLNRSTEAEALLYKRKYSPLHDAVELIADRLVASDRQSYADPIEEARKQLVEALFEGAIRAEGVLRYHRQSSAYKPPSLEYDEWTPIPQGLWSHERCYKCDDSCCFLDEFTVCWNDDYLENFNKRNGEIACVYDKIRILRTELDREFRAPEATLREDAARAEPKGAIYRTGAAGRPTSKYLAELEMQRRANQGILCSGVAAEARELCQWLKREHPQAAQPKPKSLENSLRDEYQKLRQSMDPPGDHAAVQGLSGTANSKPPYKSP